MKHPSSKKEIQQLNGRIVALSRFISRLAERYLPFFKTLWQTKDFLRSDECRQSFEDLKKYLASPPLLTKSKVREILYLYLVTSTEAVSSVLIQENKNQIQRSVYYTSKVLHNAEVRYSRVEKMIYALIISSQRLRPYFQAHPIIILTDQPLKAILHQPDTSDRMVKWVIKLSEFDIQYRPRPSMKAQVLADFVVKCTIPDNKSEDETSDTIKQAMTPESDLTSIWVLHIDGASNAQGSEVGLILTNFEGVITEYTFRFNFKASNNQVEYEALLVGLKIIKELDIDSLKVFTDSQLIAGQIKDKFEVRDPIMIKYLQKMKDLTSILKYFEIFHILRTENARADMLSRLAITFFNLLGRTFVECLEQSSIDKVEKVLRLTVEPSWMDPIVQ